MILTVKDLSKVYKGINRDLTVLQDINFTIEKGQVCIGISTPYGSRAKTFEFGRSRKNNIDMFSRLSLNLLREEILSINI